MQKAGETRRLHPVPQNANRRSLVLAMYLPTMHQQFEMAAADVSPVLRCSLCNKPFGKRECATVYPDATPSFKRRSGTVL